MSIECGICERDLRGGHADDCSRRSESVGPSTDTVSDHDPVLRLAEDFLEQDGVLRADELAARIRAFLEERDAERAGQLAALRSALETAFRVGGDVGLKPIDALLQALDILKLALANDAGRREAKVLRAADRYYETDDPNDLNVLQQMIAQWRAERRKT